MVVTRFAPSPTGYLHIGGARTALFCWLLARHNGGKFLLRIEDTDQKRNTPTAAAQVMADLRWLGIEWDEGPEVGGPNGPYSQSERLDIYQIYMQQLLNSGKAYYCFDTAEELDAMRQEAIARKETFSYNRPEVFPTTEEVEQARAEGRPVIVRFAVPQNRDIVVKDIIRGEVTFAAGQVGDFVIQKSDGFPTYHFACVVDDELMGVTHVLRGQEHLMNTPGHMMLQEGLGFRTPVYAHMSVTVSEGGGKLSKRDRAKTLKKAIESGSSIDLDKLSEAGGLSRTELDTFLAGDSTPDAPQVSAMAEYLHIHLPEINVVDFQQSGYIPEAMVNFIALLGWSAADGREIMTVDELIGAFDPNRLNKTNSLFDRQKLVAFNTEHMKLVDPDKLLGYFKNYLHLNESPMANNDDITLAHILKACAGARTLADVEAKCGFLMIDQVEFDPKAVQKVLRKEGVEVVLRDIHTLLANLADWNVEAVETAITDYCQAKELGMGKVAQPIRVAITGSTVSPGIGDSLILLGREETLRADSKCNRFYPNESMIVAMPTA